MILKIILRENVNDARDIYNLNYEGLVNLLVQGLNKFLERFLAETNAFISTDSDDQILEVLNKSSLKISHKYNPDKQTDQEKAVLNIYILNRQRFLDYINVSIFSLIDLFPEEQTNSKSKPLFLRNTKGKILVWQACIRIEDNKARIYRKYGCLDGKLQETSREVLINQSGRTIFEQSVLELKSETNKKMLKGYIEDLNESNDIVRPMLANIYKPSIIKKWPVLIQAKLDGIRCFSTIDPQGDIILKTRENKEIQQKFKDIRDQLKLLFKYLPQIKFLDGELYYEDFFLLAGIVKTVEEHKNADVVKYYIFDFIEKSEKLKTPDQITNYTKDSKLVYHQRYNILKEAFQKFYTNFKKSATQERKIRLLKCFECNNDDEVQKYFKHFREKGHEGAIIRNPNAGYKGTRCNDLLKLKEFFDEELEIVDVVSGNGTDKGLAIFVVRDAQGNTMNVRPKAKKETREYWFNNKTKLLHQKCTVRYFKKREEEGSTTYIMPVAVAIRDYE